MTILIISFYISTMAINLSAGTWHSDTITIPARQSNLQTYPHPNEKSRSHTGNAIIEEAPSLTYPYFVLPPTDQSTIKVLGDKSGQA
jgi:hypothetical protein